MLSVEWVLGWYNALPSRHAQLDWESTGCLTLDQAAAGSRDAPLKRKVNHNRQVVRQMLCCVVSNDVGLLYLAG